MTTHTAGPWESLPEESDKPYVRIRGTVLGGRYKIANVLKPIYEDPFEWEEEETRANVRLIAAAPELLEALQELLSYGLKMSAKHEAPAFETARAAIAKATGT